MDNTEDINVDFSEMFACIELNNDINSEMSELTCLIDKSKHISEMKKLVNRPSTSIEELKNIHSKIVEYGFTLPEYTNRMDLFNQINISVEENILITIKDRIVAIIKKIVDIIRNFVAINRILANLLDRELKVGVLSNIRAKAVAFSGIYSPFYYRDMLMSNINKISKIRYLEDIKQAPTLEKALGPLMVDALSKLGWSISENTLNKHSEKEVNTLLIKMGWKIDDLPVIARDINSLLMNNLIEGRRSVKVFEHKVKETSDIDTADKLRKQLIHIQRTVNIVQDIGVTVAWCIIYICRKIK